MADRLATFDKTALLTVKKQITSITLPQEAEMQTSYNEFLKSLSWPGLQLRMPVFGGMYSKYGVEKVEKNMGFYVGEGNKQLQKNN